MQATKSADRCAPRERRTAGCKRQDIARRRDFAIIPLSSTLEPRAAAAGRKRFFLGATVSRGVLFTFTSSMATAKTTALNLVYPSVTVNLFSPLLRAACRRPFAALPRLLPCMDVHRLLDYFRARRWVSSNRLHLHKLRVVQGGRHF